MNTLELINIISPEHSRTSCSDKELYNGLYSNEHSTRCARCTLLEIIKKGLPKSHKAFITFDIDVKLAKLETEDY